MLIKIITYMRFSKEIKVGLLAIVSLTILYLGFNFLRGIDFFSPTSTYYVIYDEVDGLNPGNNVVINGFAVGRVSNISLLPQQNNQILVQIDIDDKIELGRNTVAILKSSDVLGTKVIELVVETPVINPIADGGYLEGELDRGIVSALLETAEPITADLSTTIRNLNIILETLANNTAYITSTLNNVEQTSQGLKRMVMDNRVQMNQMLANYNEVALDLSRTLREIPPVLIKASQVADSIQSLDFSQTMAKTQQAIETLNSALAKLDEGQGTLANLINDDSLYVNLNKAAEDLDRLLIDIRENPGRYINFSIFGSRN
jgi:phospholipid/cholesterol/gamma-HCH transport system substrate-binding protein